MFVKKKVMYNPTIKQIKPLQCLKCGSETTKHQEHPFVNLATIQCQECESTQVMQIPIYRELRKKWLTYKLERIQIIAGLCRIIG